jgi:shikimate kinase
MNSCIIIRGPMGCGKTTVSHLLSSKIKACCIAVDDLLIKYHLDDIDPKLGCIPAANYLRIYRSELVPLQTLREKSNILLVGCFYHRQELAYLEQNLGPALVTITLDAPLDVCIERDRNRSRSYGKKAVETVYALVKRFEAGITIDASGTVEDTVSKVIAHLPSGMLTSYTQKESP